jgi:hypothetical protein
VKNFLRDLPWDIIGGILGLVSMLVLATWLVYAHIDDYRGQCHDAGGHIISVRDEEICVDRENRVIFL